MPRLRYYKNFNYEAIADSDDNNSVEGDSGKSWLSNAQIISSFSTSKLEEALQRYRAIVRLLEMELLSRSFSNRKHPAESSSNDSHLSFDPQERDRNGRTTAKRERNNNKNYKVSTMRAMLRTLKISPEAKRLLFEQWCKIQQEEHNHGSKVSKTETTP
jgi:hypothetical protein